MWSACVGVYQLLNWKMNGETLKFKSSFFRLDIESTSIQENMYDRTGTIKQSGSKIMAMVILYCYERALLNVWNNQNFLCTQARLNGWKRGFPIQYKINWLYYNMSDINIPIWYHSSGLPASLRAESRAYLNANKTLQLIQRGGSPVAVTEHVHTIMLITPL